MQATDDEILEVGHRVSKCLRAAGLSVEWDEDAHETILIKVWLVCQQSSVWLACAMQHQSCLHSAS